MAFTKKQKKEYIDNFGLVCPYCCSRNIEELGMIEFDDDGAPKQDVECYDCDKLWENIYELVNIMEENDRRD
ncbi:hypothetical protein LCGC14_1819850 [marine sediment metagenome]|uniref:Uncharacterized protein n=1 Tax=marine sediment metagenome TaxID=412755 RepID=A0A0F9H7F2_9ZZZZ